MPLRFKRVSLALLLLLGVFGAANLALTHDHEADHHEPCGLCVLQQESPLPAVPVPALSADRQVTEDATPEPAALPNRPQRNPTAPRGPPAA